MDCLGKLGQHGAVVGRSHWRELTRNCLMRGNIRAWPLARTARGWSPDAYLDESLQIWDVATAQPKNQVQGPGARRDSGDQRSARTVPTSPLQTPTAARQIIEAATGARKSTLFGRARHRRKEVTGLQSRRNDFCGDG